MADLLKWTCLFVLAHQVEAEISEEGATVVTAKADMDGARAVEDQEVTEVAVREEAVKEVSAAVKVVQDMVNQADQVDMEVLEEVMERVAPLLKADTKATDDCSC